jgi:hypothetical protein
MTLIAFSDGDYLSRSKRVQRSWSPGRISTSKLRWTPVFSSRPSLRWGWPCASARPRCACSPWDTVRLSSGRRTTEGAHPSQGSWANRGLQDAWNGSTQATGCAAKCATTTFGLASVTLRLRFGRCHKSLFDKHILPSLFLRNSWLLPGVWARRQTFSELISDESLENVGK